MIHAVYARADLLIRRGFDLVLPARCALSGDIVEAQGMLSAGAWSKLHFIADPFCLRCGVPFGFEEAGETGSCMSCLDNPPPFSMARAPLVYNAASRDLILGFKHGDKTHLVRCFTPWLQQAGGLVLAGADYLIPVPLHRRQLAARRYNQAALMAESLSRACGVMHLPAALKRVRATPSQGHLDRNARADNVAGAFAVSKRYADILVGKTLVLVDDVYTTGATVRECVDVLKREGAHDVRVLTLARVTVGL